MKMGIVGVQNVTVTLIRDRIMDAKEIENVTPKNKNKVATAICRKALDTQVFPIEVTV
jgi:hypothetical protein